MYTECMWRSWFQYACMFDKEKKEIKFVGRATHRGGKKYAQMFHVGLGLEVASPFANVFPMQNFGPEMEHRLSTSNLGGSAHPNPHEASSSHLSNLSHSLAHMRNIRCCILKIIGIVPPPLKGNNLKPGGVRLAWDEYHLGEFLNRSRLKTRKRRALQHATNFGVLTFPSIPKTGVKNKGTSG